MGNAHPHSHKFPAHTALVPNVPLKTSISLADTTAFMSTQTYSKYPCIYACFMLYIIISLLVYKCPPVLISYHFDLPSPECSAPKGTDWWACIMCHCVTFQDHFLLMCPLLRLNSHDDHLFINTFSQLHHWKVWCRGCAVFVLRSKFKQIQLACVCVCACLQGAVS